MAVQSMCTLDLSKAFDRTNHYALLIKLMHQNLPVQLLTLLNLLFRVSVSLRVIIGTITFRRFEY